MIARSRALGPEKMANSHHHHRQSTGRASRREFGDPRTGMLVQCQVLSYGAQTRLQLRCCPCGARTAIARRDRQGRFVGIVKFNRVAFAL